jgi:hypothetical protein
MILSDPGLTFNEIKHRLLRDYKVKASALTVAGIRSSFRADLRLLMQEGVIPYLDLYSTQDEISHYPDQDEKPLYPKRRYRRRTWWPDG